MGSEHYFFLIIFIKDHIYNAKKFGERISLHSNGSAQSEIHYQELMWIMEKPEISPCLV